MKKGILLLLCVVLLTFAASCGSHEVSGVAGEEDRAVENLGSSMSNTTAETIAHEKSEYKVGETWVVDGQWELTITGVSETEERNEYADKKPAAVYLVDFTWKNVGYVDESGFMDGLFLVLDDSVIDCQGFMGYSYPGEITDYPQETPVGASCNGQVCIGVDNAGLPITINVIQYDGNEVEQKATFIVE